MEVGDKVIRVYDGAIGWIDRMGPEGMYWVRFSDGTLRLACHEHLRPLALVVNY